MIWVCLKIGYIPNYSHLIGIMISKTIGYNGVPNIFRHTHFSHETHLVLNCSTVRPGLWVRKHQGRHRCAWPGMQPPCLFHWVFTGILWWGVYIATQSWYIMIIKSPSMLEIARMWARKDQTTRNNTSWSPLRLREQHLSFSAWIWIARQCSMTDSWSQDWFVGKSCSLNPWVDHHFPIYFPYWNSIWGVYCILGIPSTGYKMRKKSSSIW